MIGSCLHADVGENPLQRVVEPAGLWLVDLLRHRLRFILLVVFSGRSVGETTHVQFIISAHSSDTSDKGRRVPWEFLYRRRPRGVARGPLRVGTRHKDELNRVELDLDGLRQQLRPRDVYA
jgi:hypothetical protein